LGDAARAGAVVMRCPLQRGGLALASFGSCCGGALAQELAKPLSDPPTGREAFLAGAIFVMILCGLASFLLMGRIAERTHVALAMLGVLTGGFALLVLFGGALYDNPLAAAFVLLLLVALFKLMSQFESSRKRRKD
jgi:hypothetical protein